jgi:hypothetical protein
MGAEEVQSPWRPSTDPRKGLEIMPDNCSQLEALRGLHRIYFEALQLAECRIGCPASYEPDDEGAKIAWRNFRKKITSLLCKIDPACRRLLASGFDVPIPWLAVDAIGDVTRRTYDAADGLPISEVEYGGFDGPAFRRVCGEIRAAIMRLEVGVSGLDGSTRWSRPIPKVELREALNVCANTLKRRLTTSDTPIPGKIRYRGPQGARKIECVIDDLPDAIRPKLKHFLSP